jgi:hypothetical protein
MPLDANDRVVEECDHKTNLVDQRKVNGQLTATNAVMELNFEDEDAAAEGGEIRSMFLFYHSWFLYFIQHVE